VPIHFTCPHCGAPNEFDETFVGQTGHRVRCGKALNVSVRGDTPFGQPRNSSTRLIVAAAIVLCIAVLVGGSLATWWWPTRLGGGEGARIDCMGNLKRLAAAMREYESQNGNFPPAYVTDKHGRRMHSWRALLLPYLGHQDLADRYRLDEPWNSPANRAVADLAVAVFQCPAQPGINRPITSYMMVVGPHTISNGQDSRRTAEITDGTDNTIMLVEVADSDVPWAEPKDLQFDEISFKINGRKEPRTLQIGSHHPHGANIAFCDGTIRFLKNSLNPQLVKAMLTVDGGEHVPPASRY
jgi:prepilin-type processing-associated H-X9-DG protein